MRQSIEKNMKNKEIEGAVTVRVSDRLVVSTAFSFLCALFCSGSALATPLKDDAPLCQFLVRMRRLSYQNTEKFSAEMLVALSALAIIATNPSMRARKLSQPQSPQNPSSAAAQRRKEGKTVMAKDLELTTKAASDLSSIIRKDESLKKVMVARNCKNAHAGSRVGPFWSMAAQQGPVIRGYCFLAAAKFATVG